MGAEVQVRRRLPLPWLINQVRRWIDRGLVDAQLEDFEQHRGVYWVRLDRATVRRLAKLSTM